MRIGTDIIRLRGHKGELSMAKKLEEIISAAMELSLKERAQLAGTLLLSLDEP
jgi:hypothetical protein